MYVLRDENLPRWDNTIEGTVVLLLVAFHTMARVGDVGAMSLYANLGESLEEEADTSPPLKPGRVPLYGGDAKGFGTG